LISQIAALPYLDCLVENELILKNEVHQNDRGHVPVFLYRVLLPRLCAHVAVSAVPLGISLQESLDF
tara:strand:+ start:421 stop:621 length:201 start_codon:yes stop_codon:yes gene_type:complete